MKDTTESLPILVEQIERLEHASVTREEIQRQIKLYPSCHPDELLRQARTLTEGPDEETERAIVTQLTPFIRMEASYVTSGGPCGRTHDVITPLNHPEPPGLTWTFRAIVVAVIALWAHAIVYKYPPIAAAVSLVIVILVHLERIVRKGACAARSELDTKIMRQSKRLAEYLRKYS